MAISNKDIEHALICCGHSDCDNCPFYREIEDCEVELPEQALRLVNYYKKKDEELKAKNKELKSALKTATDDINSYKIQVSKLGIKIKSLYKEIIRISRYTVAESSHDKDDPRDRV